MFFPIFCFLFDDKIMLEVLAGSFEILKILPETRFKDP
jgi:hypothetical protein